MSERSVASVVRRVCWSLRATHALESALLFVAGSLVAQGSAVLSGAEDRSQALVLLCGGLCALTWWLEHPVGLADTARSLDRRLQQRDALTTAFEIEERGSAPSPPPSPMEELVRQRVLARLRVGEALRSLFPSLLVPLGAPVAAGLLLWAAQDARREAPAPADLGAQLHEFQGALARGAGSEPGEAPAPGADGDELQAILARSRSLRIPLDPLEEDDRTELQHELLALERDLARVSASLSEGSERRQSLEEARVWLDALRMGLAEPAAGPGGGGKGAEGTGGDRDGTISRSNSRPSPAANAPMDSRMDAPMPAQASPPPDVRATPVLGRQSGNGWPREYDGVVRRWIELSRRAADGAGGR